MQRLEVDCSTGEERVIEMTDEEVALHESLTAARDEFVQKHRDKKARARQLVEERAEEDPHFAALLELIT